MPRGVKKGVDTKKFDRCVEKVEDKLILLFISALLYDSYNL